MAASLLIEEESGTYTARFRHPHNGYYAGDFSQTSRPRPAAVQDASSAHPTRPIRVLAHTELRLHPVREGRSRSRPRWTPDRDQPEATTMSPRARPTVAPPTGRPAGRDHRRLRRRRRRRRPGARPGRVRRRHRGHHHRGPAARLRVRLGADGDPDRALHRPAAALGRRPGGRHGRHRARPAGPHPRQRRHDRAELGVAAAACWRSPCGCSSRCAAP